MIHVLPVTVSVDLPRLSLGAFYIGHGVSSQPSSGWTDHVNGVDLALAPIAAKIQVDMHCRTTRNNTRLSKTGTCGGLKMVSSSSQIPKVDCCMKASPLGLAASDVPSCFWPPAIWGAIPAPSTNFQQFQRVCLLGLIALEILVRRQQGL